MSWIGLRLLSIFSLAGALSVAALGQRPNSSVPTSSVPNPAVPNSFGLGGNAIRPGIPRGGPATPGFVSVPSPVPAPSPVLGPVPFNSLNTISQGFAQNGLPPVGSKGRGRAGRGFGGFGVVVPFGFGYGGPVHSPPPGQYDPIFGVFTPPLSYFESQDGQQAPTVVINQNFSSPTANPVVHDYSNTQLPPARSDAPQGQAYPQQGNASTQQFRQQGNPGPSIYDGQQTIYLIAMNDHTIMPAVAYWMEGDTLNYVTTQGVRNRATLGLVDRAMTQRLNEERGVQVTLPQ